MKAVRIAELKAHLSEYLRGVRRGESLILMDRDTAIARIVPFDGELGLVVRPAHGSFHDVTLPPPLDLPIDAVDVLLEDRAGR